MKFTLRDWFWLTLVLAMILGAQIHGCHVQVIHQRNQFVKAQVHYDRFIRELALRMAKETNREVMVTPPYYHRPLYAHPDGNIRWAPKSEQP